MSKYPITEFPAEFDEGDFKDMQTKGRAGVQVHIDDQKKVYVLFYDLNAIASGTESAEKAGFPCFYRENLIILTELTKEKIEDAVKYLFESKYFDHR